MRIPYPSAAREHNRCLRISGRPDPDDPTKTIAEPFLESRCYRSRAFQLAPDHFCRECPGGTEYASIFATVRGSIPNRRAASRRLTPPRTPLVEPARIVPPASSLRPPLPLPGKWAIAAGFLLQCNRSIRLLREGFSLWCSHQVQTPPPPQMVKDTYLHPSLLLRRVPQEPSSFCRAPSAAASRAAVRNPSTTAAHRCGI
jgi:hypothetical protein